MEDKKIEIDFVSGETLKADKKNIFKTSIGQKFIIIVIFLVFLILFSIFIIQSSNYDTSNKTKTDTHNTNENKISDNITYRDKDNILTPKSDKEYIKLTEDYNTQVLVVYEDLKIGYLSTIGFSSKIEKIQKSIIQELEEFSSFEKIFKDDNNINTYNFIYSRMANTANYISNIKKLTSEKEIKKAVFNYMEADKELIDSYNKTEVYNEIK